MSDAPEPSEPTRLQVEANKEIELAKIQLARDQFEYEKANSSRLTTAQVALLTSILSLASGAAGAGVTGWFTKQSELVKAEAGKDVEEVKAGSSINLEKIKFETNLIIKAISTDDQQKATKTLKFFAKAGLIPEYEGKVLALTESDGGKDIPALDQPKPSLYALLIAVGAYANSTYPKLLAPVRDAEGLAKALLTQKGGLYGDVQVNVITDSEASREGIFKGLNWLKRSGRASDLSIVFLSGVGARDSEGRFWFLTNQAEMDNLEMTAVSGNDLQQYLSVIPGKTIVFVDACYSGKLAEYSAGAKSGSAQGNTRPPARVDSGVNGTTGALSTAKTGELPGLDLTQVIKDFSSAGPGLAVLSSTTGTECSFESPEWDNHSAFGKALIEAIGEGKASNDSSGRITIQALNQYIAERVSALTGGKQHTVLSFPKDAPDYPVALARP